MKIKTLIASLLLGTATMAMAGPSHLFGLSPFGDGPMQGGRMAGVPKAGQLVDGAPKAGLDAEQAKAAAERRAQWMAHEMTRRIERVVRSVDGTPEQADKASAIAKAAFDDLRPLREQVFKLDERARELFKAQRIDKTAFSALRVERQKLSDAISQRSLDAYVEIAALFSAEQREKLAERMGRGMKGGKHHGDKAHRRGGRHDEHGVHRRGPREGEPAQAAEGGKR
ncbi:MAG: hypothetical protein Q4D91_10275 [Lautropia sp.]|nr:hypothetical protein [Lautropia sp.]